MKDIDKISIETTLGITDSRRELLVRCTYFMGILLALIGAVVIFEWYAEIVPLTRTTASSVSMKINTAVAFFLLGCGISSLAYARLKNNSAAWHLVGQIFTGLAGMIGLASGVQYIFPIDLGIDEFFGQNSHPGTLIQSGRMPPATALCFTFQAAIFCIQGIHRRRETIAQISSFVVVLIAYSNIIGYLYGAPQLSGIGRFNIMAIHTSMGFILTGLAGLAFNHDHRLIAVLISPTPAGKAARELTPVVFIGPMALGWLRLTFFSNQLIDSPLTTAILVTSSVGLLSLASNYLIWKIHEQYMEKVKTEAQMEEQKNLLVWREKLAASLVHDLRTPLMSARLSAEIMLRKDEMNQKRVQDLGKLVIRATDRCERLIRNILDSARAISGEVPNLILTSLSLCSVLKQIIPLQSRTDDRIVVECSENINGEWDEDALIRIVENLVSNAMKYGDQNSQVRVSDQMKSPDSVIIEVHNWGNPIPSEEQNAIFRLFVRQDKVQLKPGWGVGLAAVKTLTMALGGTVIVDSSQERGTTFRVELPRFPAKTNMQKIA